MQQERSNISTYCIMATVHILSIFVHLQIVHRYSCQQHLYNPSPHEMRERENSSVQSLTVSDCSGPDIWLSWTACGPQAAIWGLLLYGNTALETLVWFLFYFLLHLLSQWDGSVTENAPLICSHLIVIFHLWIKDGREPRWFNVWEVSLVWPMHWDWDTWAGGLIVVWMHQFDKITRPSSFQSQTRVNLLWSGSSSWWCCTEIVLKPFPVLPIELFIVQPLVIKCDTAFAWKYKSSLTTLAGNTLLCTGSGMTSNTPRSLPTACLNQSGREWRHTAEWGYSSCKCSARINVLHLYLQQL